jgi:NADH-quinone oxidoreductase subunit H
MIVVAVGFTTVMCVPFFNSVDLRPWGGPRISGAVIDIDPGILWFFAVASLTVYGIIFAGWSSGNKYSLLGAMRASAAVLSYEIPMGLSVIGPLMMYNSVNLTTISEWQGHNYWGIVYQPLAAIIFTVCGFAETNRVPFDLAESESELVAGYHTEYSSMKFGMFFLGEYVAMVVSSCLIVTLFLGGYQVPFLPTEALIANAKPILEWSLGIAFAVGLALTAILLVNFASNVGRWKDWRDYESLILAILVVGGAVTALGGLFLVMAIQLPAWFGVAFAGLAQFGMFTAKLLFLCWVFVWVRWTLPRFRYDQVMNLGWRSLLPLALVNILITGVLIFAVMPK